MLNAHYALGFVVFLSSLVAIFYGPIRRYVLYLLLLQIIVGGLTWWTLGVAPPAVHWILPILVGGVYAMASAFERRGRPAGLVMGIRAVAALAIAYVFYVGMHAVQGV
jgi:hypothetical protein